MECRKKGDLGERHSGSNEMKCCPNPNLKTDGEGVSKEFCHSSRCHVKFSCQEKRFC